MNASKGKTGHARLLGRTHSRLEPRNARKDESDTALRRAPLAPHGKRNLAIVLGLALLFLIAGLPLHAQTYAIDWFTIDGGGGQSTGGVYTVSGTIGQPDAGQMSGGNYVLTGGFWSVITVMQTPEAPWLSITRTNGSVTVSWPLPAAGFLLEETTALNVTTLPWMEVSPGLYQTNSTEIFLQVTAPMGHRFYRLHKP